MANRTLCLYGATETGKTSQIGMLARYLYEKTGKPLRYITADGGSLDPIKPYIKAGIIQPFNILSMDSPLFWITKVIEGIFPENTDETGALLNDKLSNKDYSNVSGYAIEGITSIAEAILTETKAKKLSQNAPYSFSMTNSAAGSATYTAPSQSHYGFVQQFIMEMVMKSWSLPVDTVLWTAHEAQATDDMNNKAMAGIALVGSAATPTISKKVGTLIHLQRSPEVDSKQLPTGKLETRCYFQSHPHPIYDKIPFAAKSRLHPEGLAKLLQIHKEGYYVTKLNLETGELEQAIDYYLRKEDEFQEIEGREFDKWLKGVKR